jgi:hypothetical protein
MSSKRSAIAVLVVASAALVFAGIALAADASTKVTIQAQQGGFFGLVHTKNSAAERCEANRKLILYKQTGSSQRPRQDIKIGSDIAQPNGPDSQWFVNTNKSGKFYAKAPPKTGCLAGFSPTVHSQ